ncbi:MAG: capsule assembly Wzi family protein [Bacteroidales bacterium]|nr:capsule assembly Wzi family protein [Bacteroidales bacterium]MDD4823292.1 capsule assembly Wzi family protein [Bacteroidales bacterium]
MSSQQKVLVLLWLLILPSAANSQSENRLNYIIESTSGFSNGEQAPFWLISNKQGLSSLAKDNSYLRIGVFQSGNPDKKCTLSYGLDLATAVHYSSTFIIQQAYLDLHYKVLEASLGSKERWGEMKNQRLSSGGLMYSGNARPIPQARIGIPEFVAVPFTHGWLQIRGHVAFGAFSDDRWQKDFVTAGQKHTERVLYHSKALFWRIGKEHLTPFIYEGGLEMSAQFGGNSIAGNRKTNMPNQPMDFLRVFIPSGGDKSTPLGEQTNVYGNHLGSWHSSLAYTHDEWKIRAYFEHYFEDHSMMFLEYGWKDGLAGVEITLPQRMMVQQVVLEYMTSRDQSGPIYNDTNDVIPEQISATDSYYNHGIYTGWQHWGMGIGSPLMLSPIYNTDGSITFKNNRLESTHLGVSGSLTREVSYRLLYTRSKSWGTYSNPARDVLTDTYFLWEMNYQPQRLKSWRFSASLGIDRGDMTGSNNGILLSIRKTGHF